MEWLAAGYAASREECRCHSRVAALLVGPGDWPGRLPGPFARLAGRLFARKLVRVPWEVVEAVEAAVHLGRTASELGLGRGDNRWRKRIARIPGS